MAPKNKFERFITNKIRKNDHLKNHKPLIYDLKYLKDRNSLSKLVREKKIQYVYDGIKEQRDELDIVEDPKKLNQIIDQEKDSEINLLKDGKWIFYPWRASLVHTLDNDSYNLLRISRNRNLILDKEQKKFEKFKVGIAGLNVGNTAAICLVLEGGGKEMKFADNDVLSLSNLNRFRASSQDLGINKAVLSARQVYEINPFAKIKVYSKGVQEGKTEKFLLNPKIDVLIEEMDNLKLKIEIREQAKKYRIPVLMVTGNGENVIIDIERYDLNPKLPLLSGYLKQNIIKKIKNPVKVKSPITEKILVARDFIGARYMTRRLQQSFLQVGTKLAGIPQLAESSFLRGATLCYLIRRISTGVKLPSGRYKINLDSII